MPTGIAWTEETWNPVTGCRKVSAGCNSCYAIRTAHKLAGNPNPKVAAAYEGLTMIQNGRPNWTGVFRELPERLDQPLRWAKPKRIFVNSMSDLFGEGVSDSFIEAVFAVMSEARQHQYQILTKRPERMARLVPAIVGPLPPPNVWLGVSVEDQQTADLRIPLLLETPAAVRFLSCEPLLGPIDLLRITPGGHHDYLNGERETARVKDHTGRIAWVIAGSESGPGARPAEEAWFRRLKDQCVAAGVPFFLKQYAVNGRKIHTPELDGRRWTEYPQTGGIE